MNYKIIEFFFFLVICTMFNFIKTAKKEKKKKEDTFPKILIHFLISFIYINAGVW